MTQSPVQASCEVTEARAQSGLTLEDMLRFARISMGYPPDEEQAITFGDVIGAYSQEQTIWLTQEWLRGEVEAFDPGSGMPVLSPRRHRVLRASWDYMASVIPDLGMGFGVRVEKTPTRLALYGTFLWQPDGCWSFTLHPHDLPPLRRIATGRPVTFPVSMVLRNEHSGVEVRTCLFLHIERDKSAGLVVRAEYGRYHFHGFSRTIRDLAENCIRGKVFRRDALTPRDAALWTEVVAWFFSMAFTRRLPASLTALAEEGTVENQIGHLARAAVVQRLGSMVLDRNTLEESLAKFQAQAGELFRDAAAPVAVEAVPARHIQTPVSNLAISVEAGHRPEASSSDPPDIYALMAEKLPEVLPRSKLPNICLDVLGTKLIGKSTLEKLDMSGEGPPRMEIGGRVHYPKQGFIEWFKAWNARNNGV